MNTTTNNELIRANKLTVKTDTETGCFIADFFKTHKHIMTVSSCDTAFVMDADTTATANREAFRKFISDNAADLGINYDPTDRRIETNVRKAVYETMTDLAEDAIAMVTPDIATFISKMPHSELVDGHSINLQDISPKYKTSKGTDLVMMGIDEGCYANGNLAWFDIQAEVVLKVSGQEIYQLVNMELVSGQLKKFRMTQTQWNTEVMVSLKEIGLVKDEPKEEPKAEIKKEQAGTDAGDSKPKRTRKSKKNTDEVVEG